MDFLKFKVIASIKIFNIYKHISRRLILGLLLFLMLTGCIREEVIDESFKFSRKPVVFCLISPGKKIDLSLSHSFVLGDTGIHYHYNSTQGIFNASVFVSNEQGDSVNLKIRESGVPVYSNVSPFPVIQGKTYYLTITIPDYEDTIRAATTLPDKKITFDSVQFINTPYEVKEYHHFINGKGVDWSYATYLDYNVVFTNKADFGYLIFKKNWDSSYPVNDELDIISIGHTHIFQDNILIERLDSARSDISSYVNVQIYKLITTSHELEDYFTVYEIQYNNRNAVEGDRFLEFFRGVAPEYTNINHGLGVFAGYLEDEITVEEPANWK